MKIKYIIVLFSLLCIVNCAKAQFMKTIYNYKGNGSDTGIYFWYDIVLTYDRSITMPWSMSLGNGKGIYCNHIKPDAIISNTLSNVNRSIFPASSYISYTTYEIAIDDYYQNSVFLNIASGYNQNTVTLPIDYNNMSTSVNFTNAVYSSFSSFPVNPSSLPFNILKYLGATALVESTNINIKNQAQSITLGCTDYKEAVIKLCQWIEANIKMQDNAPQTKSSQVLLNKYAKCDGAAHLLAAFCRSLNIPARIVSGYIIKHGVSYPINQAGTSSLTLGSGSGTTLAPHTACEIYVPHMNNWVRCDPAQRTALFGPQQFIKIVTEMETIGLQHGYSYIPNSTQYPIPQIIKIALNPSVFISGHLANYKFVSSETFPSSPNTAGNFGLLCAADPNFGLGLYDKITIQDPEPGRDDILNFDPLFPNTYIMEPCSPANFHARFVSGSTPLTYPVRFDWLMVLYRSDGTEYIYAQENDIWPNTYNYNDWTYGCYWQPDLGSLPAYDWLYDPSGNIYGKVSVVVYISDGDIKADQTNIGILPVKKIHDVTYNANTTINACSDIHLKNIQIQGTSIVTFNMNGFNITIDETFEMPATATFTINP